MSMKKTTATIIAGVIAFSAWWHSESTKQWLFPTYTWIYQHAQFEATRKTLDFLADLYMQVDETFYSGTGLIEEETEADSMPLKGALKYEVPSFQEMWQAKSKYLPTAEEQGRTNECVQYTIENHIEYLKRKAGVPTSIINMSRHALYRKTSYNGQDEGTVPSEAINYIEQNGYPLPFENEYTGKDYWNKITSDDAYVNALKFTGEMYKGTRVQTLSDWEYIKQVYYSNHDALIQVSLYPHGKSWSDAYFGHKEVYAKEGKRLGGHSVMGAFIAQNKSGTSEGIWIVDSAFYPTLPEKSTDGRDIAIRYIDRSYFDNGYARVRFILKDNPYQILKTATIRYGESGENVRVLQEYLISQNCTIPAGATGYFGEQTRSALSCWQIKNLGKDYGGRLWGRLSQQAF